MYESRRVDNFGLRLLLLPPLLLPSPPPPYSESCISLVLLDWCLSRRLLDLLELFGDLGDLGDLGAARKLDPPPEPLGTLKLLFRCIGDSMGESPERSEEARLE